MRCLLILFLLMTQIHPVLATNAELKGVWRGKVGELAVVACFNGDERGSYYYSRYKTPIQLSLNAKDNTWAESGSPAVWKFDVLTESQMSGLWREPKSGKTVPVELDSPSNQTDHQPCASDEYNNVLEIFPALKIGKTEGFSGRKYRKLRVADVETLEILSHNVATKKVNRDLRNLLPKTREDLNEYYEKRREFLGNMGLAAEDETFAEPRYWTADWLTVHYYRWAAGHGARGISLSYRTWNLHTGEEVDVWQWFGTESSEYDDTAQLTPKLKTFLFKHWKADPECVENYYGEGTYHATLEPTGILFWENAYGAGCEKEILIPYAKLSPILSAKGKLAITTFIKKH